VPAPHDHALDLACLLALQQGESAALNRLIERWQRPLYHFAFRYVQNAADAQDLVAETFVRLYQQRMRLRPDTKLSAWLFTTLSNRCHNHHRWKRRHPTVALERPETGKSSDSQKGLPAFDPCSEQPSPDAALDHNETVTEVRAAIDRLPHDLKVTLILHHYDHLSYREIGEITGCSERGIETRLYRARHQLKQLLTGFLSEPTRR
jgi:RNA polymerase sigma-70 factor (ECF subfamily)